MKPNSTSILIEDATFYNGEGIALGSIGQYKGQFETIENMDLQCAISSVIIPSMQRESRLGLVIKWDTRRMVAAVVWAVSTLIENASTISLGW